MTRIEHWIGGKTTPGTSERTSPVYDPATGAVTADVVLATPADVAEAVEVARGAYDLWSQASLSQRSKVLFAFRELVNEHIPQLASLVTGEHGKVLSDARGRGAARPGGGRVRVRHPAAAQGRLLRPGVERRGRLLLPRAARRRRGHHARSTSRSWCRCGCTRSRSPVAMRSCSSPASATRRPRCSSRSSGSARVCRTVCSTSYTATRQAVDALLDSDGIAAVSFVGSTPIARYIHERASATGKRVQALGGAKNHAVVLPDADLDFAADHLVAAAFGSAGERCMAISAAVAVGAAGDALVDAGRRQGARRAGRVRARRRCRDGPGR